jgi:hypothetical protein
MICSLCCGETRSPDKCGDCSFFKDISTVRNYRQAPFHTVTHMADSRFLQNQAQVIETAICQFDRDQHGLISDKVVKKIIELLLDKYHFKDEKINFPGKLEENGFGFIDQCINQSLPSLDPEKITKMLGTIYRSLERHALREREYIDFISDFGI